MSHVEMAESEMPLRSSSPLQSPQGVGGAELRSFHGENCKRTTLTGAYLFLNPDEASPGMKRAALIYQSITTMLIVLLLVVDSRTEVLHTTKTYKVLELIATLVFLSEYLIRVYVCILQDETRSVSYFDTCRKRTSHRIKFMLSIPMVLDFLTIASMGADLVWQKEAFRGFQAIRLFRLLNILRVERTFRILRPILSVIWQKRHELISTLGIAAFLLLWAAASMFYIESPTNPQFESMGDSLWWATAVLTTVGYGDIVPATKLGKLTGALTAFMGLIFFAVPVGIVSSGFQEIMFQNAGRDSDDGDSCDNMAAKNWHRMLLMEQKFETFENKVDTQLEGLRRELDRVAENQRQILRLLQAQTRSDAVSSSSSP
eukprot:TRINITY_DN93796_c0_g1_i1.p1 TRINITY_DN93796_c0_g1~~TRINITY_DN93796_c0_g1_i1.p1  ORF type:complete len:373 (-),score=77.20 TRINITY_DN93796_c0_g1_i1:539-1657(-)